MLELNNQYVTMKRKIDTEVLKLYFKGQLESDINSLPYKIIPKDRTPSRCCIYKERAMVRYRIMALLGINLELDDDEEKDLASYVQDVKEKDPYVLPILTTIKTACYGCPPDQYRISDSCRGCFARPCMANCPKNSIVFINGRAHINEETCIKCGKCMDVCPFHAVIHIPVPCENACPVGAIKKNEEGVVEIDHSKCISCGRCARGCPFGAIETRSGLFPVLKMLEKGEKVIAAIAPAIEGQFPGSLGQIKSAILKLGFSDVVEVAKGAEVTAKHEAHELTVRKEEGLGYMTTSCCPAYMELVDKHFTFLKEKSSSAASPMIYTSELIKEEDKDAKVVFVGPCLAKRVEAIKKGNVDGVITFSELAALFIAKNIDVREEVVSELGDTQAFQDCREFAVSSGVASCVLSRIENKESVKVMPINGLDKKMYKLMNTWSKRAPDTDIVEVMCCEGGCLNGPGTIVKPSVAQRLRGGNKAATPVRTIKGV